MSIQQENFKNIADAIRAKTGKKEPIVPSAFAAAIGDVYESGQNSMYGSFWDAFQQNGNRVNYDYGFYGRQWNEGILKPKHRIAPTSANQMFLNNNYKGDLRTLSSEDDFLDFSACTNVSNLFAYANQISHIGKVDMSSATSIAGAFVGCTSLVSIDEVVFNLQGTQAPGSSIFKNCSALQHVKISGKIGQSISFGESKMLSRDSIESIVDALLESVRGQTLTLSQTAVDNAFKDAEAEWEALMSTKSFWNFSTISP